MYTFRIWNKSDNIGTLTPKEILAYNPSFSDNDVIIINYGEKIVEYGDVPTMRHHNLFPLDLTSEEVGQRYIDLKNELIKPSQSLQDKIDILESENNRLKEVEKEQDKMIIDNSYKMAMIEANLGGM
jgi:hypothetical protein